MKLADIPYRISTPWAASAGGSYVTIPIPVPAQSGNTASFETGFPPQTFVDPLAGGGYPLGTDENGINYIETAWLRWMQAGGPIAYDGAQQTTIGGYPRGTVILSATTTGLQWISTVDDNSTNPDTGGAGWLANGSFVTYQISAVGITTLTVPDFCNEMWLEIWGGGGGSSGSDGGGPATIGASGGAGGYHGGWHRVVPGETLTANVGGGGGGASSGAQAGNGGTSSVSGSSSGVLGTATGGVGGSSGAGQGGTGSGSGLNIQGQGGTDLDGGNPSAPGGCAPRGGMGGIVNGALQTAPPTLPGGGGGCNYLLTSGFSGTQGGVFIQFKISVG